MQFIRESNHHIMRHHVASAMKHTTDSSYSEESDSDMSVGPQEDIAPFRSLDLVKKSITAPVATQESAVVAKRHYSVDDKLKVLTAVMQFLPLHDIETARAAGPLFELAASRVAPRPLPTKDVVFYRYTPQLITPHSAFPGMATHANTHRHFHHAATPAVPTVFQWRCLACGHISVGPRNCNTCRTPLAVGGCRVFLGQIRKDLSAEMATAMVRTLLPHVTVLHMESHTNGIDGRGKGCAWAYVDSVEDALAITTLHKRVFVDLDADHAEGFWFVKDASLAPRLAAMAEEVSVARSRPQWLPRQPLVAELPAKSMLANFVNGVYA